MKVRSSVRFGLMTAIGITFLTDMGVIVIATAMMGVTRFRSVVMLAGMGIVQLLLMLLPTLYIGRRQSIPSRELLRLRPAPPMAYLAAILGTASLWIVAQIYQLVQQIYLVPPKVYEFFDRSTSAISDMLTAHTPAEFALMLAAAAVIPAISEELLFRGITQRSLERELSPGRSILFTSLLFATVHLEPLNWVTLLGFSCFVGLLAWKTGSIFPSMLCHFLFNATAVVLGYLYGDHPEAGHRLTGADLAPLLIPTAIAAIILILVIRWLLRQERPLFIDDAISGEAASAGDSPAIEHPSEPIP